MIKIRALGFPAEDGVAPAAAVAGVPGAGVVLALALAPFDGVEPAWDLDSSHDSALDFGLIESKSEAIINPPFGPGTIVKSLSKDLSLNFVELEFMEDLFGPEDLFGSIAGDPTSWNEPCNEIMNPDI
ncbi:hypothetical protein WICPIJ_003811 [Wickerhamomyces pijperi]|uniref:Uncharacterized protein n=1 Tax=Wickerhamomyces pijperi TaxID=599730 RepID=A0A9P8Q6G6_WICPI|nr:hypothetical protein WICPIJ_003811 [Wickerhamomyces pijperi]